MIFIRHKETGETRSFEDGEQLSMFFFGRYIPDWELFVGVPFDISGGEVNAFATVADNLASLVASVMAKADAEFDVQEKSVKASINRGVRRLGPDGKPLSGRII